MNLRIFINAVSAKSGGAATYIRNLLSEFAQRRCQHQYFLFISAVQPGLMYASRNNVTILKTDIGHRSSWWRYLWDQVALRWILKKEGVDILLSSSDFGMLLPPCKQILMVRNSLFFSPLYIERILPSKSKRFKVEFLLRRWLISLSVKSLDVVMTASQSMLDDFRRYISVPEGKTVVNYFGVPLERFREGYRGGRRARSTQDGTLRMLYVSEYSDYKNLTTLLKAVRLLKQRGVENLCLVTTADPEQFPNVEVVTREEDKALASNPLVAPFVEFTGSVPYEDITKLYADSDLFVFPSLAESFGHPLVEAMASGLPILASDIPICREICDDAALYFSPLDPSDLAEKIVMLRNDSDLRKRLGQIGAKRAETHFDWRDHVRRLLEIIEQVAANSRG